MAVGEISNADKQRINAAVAKAEEGTGLEFCVIVGSRPHDKPRQEAEKVFHGMGLHQRPAVMVVVIPAGRTLEIVTAPELSSRISDQVCDEAVRLMTGLFSNDNIAEGVERGIALLAERAGSRTDGQVGHAGPDLPNVVDLDEASETD